MRYLGQGRGGDTPVTPLTVGDLSMSSVVMAKITVRPTKSMSLTLVTHYTLHSPSITPLPLFPNLLFFFFPIILFYLCATLVCLALLFALSSDMKFENFQCPREQNVYCTRVFSFFAPFPSLFPLY